MEAGKMFSPSPKGLNQSLLDEIKSMLVYAYQICQTEQKRSIVIVKIINKDMLLNLYSCVILHD